MKQRALFLSKIIENFMYIYVVDASLIFPSKYLPHICPEGDGVGWEGRDDF